MSDAKETADLTVSTKVPTTAQLAAAGLIQLPDPAAIAKGNGYAIRVWDAQNQTFPKAPAEVAPGTVLYSSKNYTEPNTPPVVTPPVTPPVVVPTFIVTYNGNGNTGGSDPIDPIKYGLNANTSVLGFFTLVKTGSTFIGWNTKADGSGTKYAVGAALVVSANITLYAQWTPVVVTPPPVTPPPAAKFTAQQVGTNEITVSWSGFSPVLLGRNGVDVNGAANWNTGPLTGQPMSGSFTFDYLVPGDTYILTATEVGGATLTATATIPGTPPVTPPPVIPPPITPPVAPPVTPPTSGLGFGINAGGVVYARANDPSNAAQFAQLKQLGAKYVRISVPWNYNPVGGGSWVTFFNADGSYNPKAASEANAIKTIAESYGLTVLFLIDGLVSTTAPTASNSSYQLGLPYSPQAFAEAAAWIASQVPGSHWELINEPDQYQFSYASNFPFTPAAYVDALTLAYPAMKAADPTCIVHMGPVANILQGGQSGWAFLEACYTINPNFWESFDIDGFHWYVYPGNCTTDNDEGATFEAQVNNLMALRTAHGNTKPVWTTETGWQSTTSGSGNGLPEMTPALQATYLVQWLQECEALYPKLEVVFQFCLIDFPGGIWGLCSSPTVEKPSFAAVQTFLGG